MQVLAHNLVQNRESWVSRNAHSELTRCTLRPFPDARCIQIRRDRWIPLVLERGRHPRFVSIRILLEIAVK
jgi:hypothetical protein